MTSKIHTAKDRGFTALIAVILLASGTLALTFTALAAAVLYSDGVYKHEWRIQKNFNENACLYTARLMVAKDAFLKGAVSIPEFGCIVGGGTSGGGTSIRFP